MKSALVDQVIFWPGTESRVLSPCPSLMKYLYCHVWKSVLLITARPDTEAMVSAIRRKDRNAIGANLQNAFEPLVAARYPVVEELRHVLLAHGAIGARLTGTGSVVYGVFCSKFRAFSAALEMEELCPEVHLAEALPAPNEP